MRRLAVYLIIASVVAFSVAAAWVASDWPHVCRMLHWCDGQGLL
jgi:hypothetical protein